MLQDIPKVVFGHLHPVPRDIRQVNPHGGNQRICQFFQSCQEAFLFCLLQHLLIALFFKRHQFPG